jgi:hypothetical protein
MNDGNRDEDLGKSDANDEQHERIAEGDAENVRNRRTKSEIHAGTRDQNVIWTRGDPHGSHEWNTVRINANGNGCIGTSSES